MGQLKKRRTRCKRICTILVQGRLAERDITDPFPHTPHKVVHQVTRGQRTHTLVVLPNRNRKLQFFLLTISRKKLHGHQVNRNLGLKHVASPNPEESGAFLGIIIRFGLQSFESQS